MRNLRFWSIMLFVQFVVMVTAVHAAPLGFGVRAGVNAADFTGELGGVVSSGMHAGFDAGVAVEWAIAPGWSFQTGLAYVRKGAKADGEGTDPFGNPTGALKGAYKLDYVELPVLLRADLLRAAPATPYLEVGPTFALPVQGKLDYEDAALSDLDLKDRLLSLDFGIAAGAGVRFMAGPAKLGAGVRYTRGLTGVFEGGPSNGTEPDIKHQGWTLALTYMR